MLLLPDVKLLCTIDVNLLGVNKSHLITVVYNTVSEF